MIDESTHAVTPDNGPRPAGKKNECFFCHETVGHLHKDDCPAYSRTVVLQVTIPVVVRVPVGHDTQLINWAWSEGSNCSSNIFRYIEKMEAQLEENYHMDDEQRKSEGFVRRQECLCEVPECKITFLREATEKDEANLGKGLPE